jgi:hypothetical protein
MDGPVAKQSLQTASVRQAERFTGNAAMKSMPRFKKTGRKNLYITYYARVGRSRTFLVPVSPPH